MVSKFPAACVLLNIISSVLHFWPAKSWLPSNETLMPSRLVKYFVNSKMIIILRKEKSIYSCGEIKYRLSPDSIQRERNSSLSPQLTGLPRWMNIHFSWFQLNGKSSWGDFELSSYNKKSLSGNYWACLLMAADWHLGRFHLSPNFSLY